MLTVHFVLQVIQLCVVPLYCGSFLGVDLEAIPHSTFASDALHITLTCFKVHNSNHELIKECAMAAFGVFLVPQLGSLV